MSEGNSFQMNMGIASYEILLLGGGVGWPTTEKIQNSVVFNPI